MLVLSRLYILLLWRRPPELSSFSPCNEWIDRCFARCAQSSLRLRHPKLCACAWVTLELHLPGCWWLSSVCPSISLNRGHRAHTHNTPILYISPVCVCLLVSFSTENWNSTHKLEINHGETVIISFAALETHQHQTDGQEEEEDFSFSTLNTTAQRLAESYRRASGIYIYIRTRGNSRRFKST